MNEPASFKVTDGRTVPDEVPANGDGQATTMAEMHNVYALRFAGVCMLSLATLGLRSGGLPRPFVFVTYALAALLIFGLSHLRWLALLFPAWVLGFGAYLLLFRPSRETP